MLCFQVSNLKRFKYCLKNNATFFLKYSVIRSLKWYLYKVLSKHFNKDFNSFIITLKDSFFKSLFDEDILKKNSK